MITFIFPGQGSQAKGMGETLFDDFPELTKKADAILSYSIKTLCHEDPKKQLSQTCFTQPAIFVVNALSYYKKLQETNRKPDFVAGHSLGEFNALLAAEVFDFETGLQLVKRRAALMGQAAGGAMCAILGLSDKEVERILEENRLREIDIANYNTPSQIVISSLKEFIVKAEPFFLQGGAKYIPLNTSGAFHSRYMQSAQEEFERYLRKFHFSDFKIPVISNVYASPYTLKNLVTTLSKQITHSVRWTQSIRYLQHQGDMTFEEIGFGGILTKLTRQIIEQSPLTAPQRKEKMPNTPQTDRVASLRVTSDSLGCNEFKKDYNLQYAYVAGGMYCGIASIELVAKMAKAGMMSYFGAGGLGVQQIEEAIRAIRDELRDGQTFGVNLLRGRLENETIEMLLRQGIQNIEAATYMQITPALVKYRLLGLLREKDGTVLATNRIMAKVSRPEVASQFLSPAPERLVKDLLVEKKVTLEQANLARKVPMADDVCVEADSAGHTDRGVAWILLPSFLRLRDEMMQRYQYSKKVRIGAAGGIGTPDAAAAAFIMGADFILTGSINQCTVEAGTSNAVKDLLQDTNIHDTAMAPAGDMFELGVKVQVLKKGVLFPARANKLYELYRNYNSLDELDENTKQQLEEKYFQRSFAEILQDIQGNSFPERSIPAETNPKQKMAFLFKSYFHHASRVAIEGKEEEKLNFQIQCGPALGAFNQWVKNTDLHDWKNRHVDKIAEKIMQGAADLLGTRLQAFLGNSLSSPKIKQEYIRNPR